MGLRRRPHLAKLGDELTIYADGGAAARPEAYAVVAPERDDGLPPAEAAGLQYVLEVDEAKSAVRTWREWNGREPTTAERIEAILYYARHDAFLPVDR